MSPAHRRRPITTRSYERRGRGLRSPLLPPDVPARKTRAEKFDLLVLDAFAPVDGEWHDRLTKLDIAVDEVPKIHARDPRSVTWPPEVVADGPVPLSRLVPAGVDRYGNTTRARIVLFRRPLEQRAKGTEELTELVHDVLVHQVGTYLDIDPKIIDPTLPDEE